MPRPPLPPELDELLAKPNPAVIAVARADGSPLAVATWYDWEGGRILVNMDAGRRRLRLMRADPRVALTILDEADWYRHVSVTGRIAELYDDADLADIDRLARRYGRDRYPDRVRARVSAWIEVERWHAWGVET